jgi:hypothetical protein
MKYLDDVQTTVTKTIYVTPKEAGSRFGDLLANSVPAGYMVVANGGIDYRTVIRGEKAVERCRNKGLFLVKYRGNYYQYVIREYIDDEALF